jgi:hypothetical protein
VFDQSLYVATFIEGISSFPLSGGNASPLFSSVNTNVYFQNPFVIQGQTIYWSESSGGFTQSAIAAGPLSGGSGQVLASPMGFISGLVVDDQNVYWVAQDDDSVQSVPIGSANGTPNTLASGLHTPGGLVATTDTLYLIDAEGDLLSVPKSGGPVTTLLTGPGLPANTSVVDWSPPMIRSDNTLYFSICHWAQNQGPDQIYRFVPGSTPTVLTTGCARGLAVDDTTLYWVDEQTLHATSLANGATQTLAQAPIISGGPALDDSHVYWGVTPQLATCGLCPPPPPHQINAVMVSPKVP